MMAKTIQVTFKFFASTREVIGQKELTVELDRGTTAEEAFNKIIEKYPELTENEKQLMIAVNKEIGDKKQRLNDGDEIAILPPVGGG
jgi:molybdopterin converting factor subunit 1